MFVDTPPDRMIFSTVYIETVLTDGKEQRGTGFFYFRRVHGSKGHEILVTNRHVVENAEKITIFFHERAAGGGPNLGEIGRVTVNSEFWRFHPDERVDIAFLLMEVLRKDLEDAGGVFLHNLDHQSVPTDAQLRDSFPIEDVTFIGYPNGIYPTFLISASVFPGSSGSPVFLYNQGTYLTRSDGVVMGFRCWLLGILTEFRYREAKGWLEFDEAPVLRAKVGVQEAIDIGVVFKEE